MRLVSPALRVPGTSSGFGGESISSAEVKAVKVASGIVAQWHEADGLGVEVETLGKNGKLNWVCTVPAQEKIGSVLHWEVTAPAKTIISGL